MFKPEWYEECELSLGTSPSQLVDFVIDSSCEEKGPLSLTLGEPDQVIDSLNFSFILVFQCFL